MKNVTISYDTYLALITSIGAMQGALQAVSPQLQPEQQAVIFKMVDGAKTASGRAIAEANTTNDEHS